MRFKVGQLVRCVEPHKFMSIGYDDGKGRGWKLGHVFKVTRVNDFYAAKYGDGGVIYFGGMYGNGVYGQALRPVNKFIDERVGYIKK